MVRIDELMIDKDLEDFYEDRDRFKGHKLLVDFKPIDIKFQTNEIEMGKPKMKKKQKAAVYIKPNSNKDSLF